MRKYIGTLIVNGVEDNVKDSGDHVGDVATSVDKSNTPTSITAHRTTRVTQIQDQPNYRVHPIPPMDSRSRRSECHAFLARRPLQIQHPPLSIS